MTSETEAMISEKKELRREFSGGKAYILAQLSHKAEVRRSHRRTMPRDVE